MARFLGLAELFERRRFDREIIVLCVRWHLRFKLSFRDLVELWPSADSRLRTPQSCVGCTIALRSSSADGTTSRSQRKIRGVWTRPM
jgi:hypothetical protein